ncbi:cyclic nucleotide-binding domain-containing protein [Cognatishimia sp. F0-27]|uniref:cyclic nucleotide-binding domain-containing protein n=1 Tax=Cognatishimia sp. F0-27 TaxID=2816855 RepID=UPI001D0C7EAB|nr:cyclic nucleotide-binding domain-containing protein [Cognatishimia sp. F0-27]MCC1491915.1 SLC26A/SulP transporter family protein [Cognatishimia sp. F0-27]
MTVASGSLNTPAQSGWVARAQAGLLAGLMATVFSITHATLVTAAVTPEATSVVIGMALMGTTVLCVILGLFSGFPGLVPMVQDVPSAAIGAILVAVVADRAAGAGVVSVPEIVILCSISGLAFSISLYVFGTLRLAAVMRFAPRPVLAGFLAGTGYFVVIGAIGICLGGVVTLDRLPELLESPVLAKAGVALSVGAALFLGTRVMPLNLVVGGVICGSLALFHAVRAYLGVDLATLAETGWTATLPEGGLFWPPVQLEELRNTDLGYITAQIFPICTMIVLATAAFLMSSSALEAKARRDLRLDQELKVLGLSNLVATALGGLPGYHGVASTLAGFSIAKPHRAISLVAGAFVLLVFMFGASILSVLPLPIFAGCMLWVGFGLLHEWLLREMRVTPISEACLTLAIFLVIAMFGLFEGTVFGLVAGAALFVVDYSRMDPVRNALSGDVFHGSTERSPEELRVLKEYGASVVIMRLQGYIFFGTAHRLRERIKTAVLRHEVTYLVIDFEAVSGIDATAVVTFERIADELEAAQVRAAMTGMNTTVAGVFRRSGLAFDTRRGFSHSTDMNTALSEFEDDVIATHMSDGVTTPSGIENVLVQIVGNAADAARLLEYLERVDVPQGRIIVAEGEQAAEVYFLETGEANVYVEGQGGPRKLRRLRAGTIIGEIAYFTSGVRSTTVSAGTDCVLWCFSPDQAKRLLEEAPYLSSKLHAGFAQVLAERVAANTRLIRMLQA